MSHPNIPSYSMTSSTQGLDNADVNAAQNAIKNDPPLNFAATGPNDPNIGGHMNGSGDDVTSEPKQNDFPEQRHAGAVGYGPEYANKNRVVCS